MTPTEIHSSPLTLNRAVGRRKTPAYRARILLVDDDELLRDIVTESLTLEGYQVDCAEDGEAGWDSLCKLEFDLMITDHNMPRLSGYELIQKMQGMPSRPRTLMITGYMPFRLNGSADGPRDFEMLAKPFSFEELIQKIEFLLKSKEA